MSLFVRGETQEDIWDDTLIIKAYNESMQLVKEEVAKRIASSTNSKTAKKKNTAEVATTSTSCTSQEKDLEYKVGDFCRATYEDGIDYEARIISKDSQTDKYLIKYIGYDNEEYVSAAQLLPSWGKKHRKQQKLASKAEKDSNSVHPQQNKTACPRVDSKVMFPPPPPMSPILDADMEDAEHLSAMLMSWYMSGYYTGFYQGQKMGRRQH